MVRRTPRKGIVTKTQKSLPEDTSKAKRQRLLVRVDTDFENGIRDQVETMFTNQVSRRSIESQSAQVEILLESL